MKKMYACVMLFFACFVMNANKTNCTQVTETVSSIADLNAQIDLMEANSSFESRTVILEHGTYTDTNITNSGLNRDIDITGGCSCEIRGELSNNTNPTLVGNISWRFGNSKNIKINQLTFRRTITPGSDNERAVIEFGGSSDNNNIENSIINEFNNGGSVNWVNIATGFNTYVIIKGSNHLIQHNIFQNKYSLGNYVEVVNAPDIEISNNTFREAYPEIFVNDDPKYARRYIFSLNSDRLVVDHNTLYNKYSHWAYVQFNNGRDNIINDNSFYETDSPDTTHDAVIKNSGYKDYIKFVNEVSPSTTENTFFRKFSLGNNINYSPIPDAETGLFLENMGGKILNNYFGPKFQLAASSMIKLGGCDIGEAEDVPAMDAEVQGNTFEDYNYQTPINPYYEVISNKSSGNIYDGNTFINCSGGLFLRCGNNVDVKNNKFLGDKSISGRVQSGVTVSGRNHRIFNNYFEDLTFPALTITAGDGTIGSYTRVDNLNFVFNTIINGYYNIRFNKDTTISQSEMATMSNIENNIFYNNESRPHHALVWIDEDFDSSNITDSNDFGTNSFDNNIFFENTTIESYEIANVTGGIHSITTWALPNSPTIYGTDPNFVDITNQDYVLGSPSPAIDAAVNVTSNYDMFVSNDIDGTLRGAEYDIGCYEYTSSSRAAAPTSVGLITQNTTQIVPNPAKDILKIKGIEAATAYEIYSINGVRVLSGIIEKQQEIDISTFQKGVYILKLDGSETIKLIKN